MAIRQDEARKRSEYLQVVEKLVHDIKYGTISVIVQDGKVVQIEQNKKIRFGKN